MSCMTGRVQRLAWGFTIILSVTEIGSSYGCYSCALIMLLACVRTVVAAHAAAGLLSADTGCVEAALIACRSFSGITYKARGGSGGGVLLPSDCCYYEVCTLGVALTKVGLAAQRDQQVGVRQCTRRYNYSKLALHSFQNPPSLPWEQPTNVIDHGPSGRRQVRLETTAGCWLHFGSGHLAYPYP